MSGGSDQPAVTQSSQAAVDPELVIGVVSPVGSDSADVAARLRAELREHCGYDVEVIRLSSYLKSEVPENEYEDQRIRRLVDAGNQLCSTNKNPAAVARLAVFQIGFARERMRARKTDNSVQRFAYVLDSLKRPSEVTLLRAVYGGQFILVGCQAPKVERVEFLMKRSLSATTEEEKREIIYELMYLDADEGNPLGQKVNDTFALADYFLGSGESPERLTRLLFGDPRERARPGEYAMYVAHATSALSLSPGRKVGATLAKKGSIIATGYNDVPGSEEPDVDTGVDASERYKIQLVRDTLDRIEDMLLSRYRGSSGLGYVIDRLKGSEIMSVIEGQRAVHAEASAVGDAAKRGVPVAGADLYCTTYPCHLCFKTAVDAHIERVFYIEPYPKSRAELMYPKNVGKLVPYEGVAPRLYMSVFRDRPVPKANEKGEFIQSDVRRGTFMLAPKNHAQQIMENESVQQSEDIKGVI